MAEMIGVVFEFRRLHLEREVIDAKTIVQFRAQRLQKNWLGHRRRMNNVSAQRLASGSDRPNVQVMHVGYTFGLQNRFLDGG